MGDASGVVGRLVGADCSCGSDEEGLMDVCISVVAGFIGAGLFWLVLMGIKLYYLSKEDWE